MHGLKLFLFKNSAADVINNGPQRRSHGDFHQSGIFYLAHQAENLGTFAAFRSHAGIPLGPFRDDGRNVGKGFHIVQI